MKAVNLVVRVKINGKRKNFSPEQAKTLDLSGTYYMRTWEGGKEKWKAVGTDRSQARIAVLRKEREFSGQSVIATSPTLREAIDTFLKRCELKQDANAIRR